MPELSETAVAFAVVTWIAGALLVLAGGAKLRRPAGTVTALRDAGLPGGPAAVRLLGAVEVAAGAGVLLLGGRAPAVAVTALYAGFTAFVVRQRRASGASCGCFGEERTPVSGVHAAVTVAATVAAAGAALTGAPAPGRLAADPVALVGTLLLVAVGAWLVRLGLTAGADLQAAVALHPPQPGTSA